MITIAAMMTSRRVSSGCLPLIGTHRGDLLAYHGVRGASLGYHTSLRSTDQPATGKIEENPGASANFWNRMEQKQGLGADASD